MSEEILTGSTDTELVDAFPEETDEQDVSAEANTPGTVLRRNREAQGLKVADVVQVIRFSARQIEALERDDYASLPGAIAVRGMVRNYAKFLRLDATSLLEQLQPAVPVSAAEVRPPANMGEAEPPTIVERVPPKLVAAGALVLLLALGAYWYINFKGTDTSFAYLVGRVDRNSGPEKPTVAANQVDTSREDTGAAVIPATPAPTPTVEQEPPVDTSADQVSSKFAGLHVEFDDLSWIEVRDATQKIVFVGEYPKGTRQNVEGKAPFQIWIGKASGVRVYMGERSIDLKPYTREEVARFSLE
ncbi:MAG: DUF4115 domain-containing protein [Sulfuritalea sp.]|nr:DUF4115 domain-containing protein [Sulfuritalea sp.]